MTDEQDARRHPVDGPTVMGPSTGHLHGPAPQEPADEPTEADPTGTTTSPHDSSAAVPRDEPTLADPAAPPPRPNATETAPTAPPSTWSSSPPAIPHDEATLAWPTPAPPVPMLPPPAAGTPQDEATIAEATPPTARPDSPQDQPTVADPTPPATRPDSPRDQPTLADPASPARRSDGPAVATPVDEVTLPGSPDDPTTAVVDESPTTTGPTVGGWPLDELLPPPPTDLVWRPDVPEPPPAARRPGYYVALGASVVLVVALVAAAAALATVMRPTREVAGSARAAQAIPDITGTAPPQATTTAPPQQAGPAEHPLSASTARMADVTCALPRFDVADDRQAAFYAAAKTCADDAWSGVLDEAGLAAGVEVVTVTGPVRTQSCGEITPDSPATQCDGTVYMTPAHLRDAEQNGRYPGRYFGVFLREYARALQFTTGLSELAAGVDDAEARLAQQATCMAGIASGAMAGRGAVDANITGEISDRLSAVDAPPDAEAMLDKGFQERTLNACNTW